MIQLLFGNLSGVSNLRFGRDIEAGRKRAFISDCEGPISKNDNAFELSKKFIPDGDKFFTLLSRYDDINAEIVKRPGYTRGNTLKLILPFLKAYGASERAIRDYSLENVSLMPGANRTLEFVEGIMPSFLVSTSYEPYLEALCKVTGFPFENTYCTKLSLDKYVLPKGEIMQLREIRDRISKFERIKLPDKAGSWEDLPSGTKKTVKELDEIFRDRVSGLISGEMLREVVPVGGVEKAKAVQDISNRIDLDFKEMMYVGDSITDVEAFRLLNDEGGLTVSFNGNGYAIRNAEVAVLAEDTRVTSILAATFKRGGKSKVLELADGWNRKIVEEICPNRELVNGLFEKDSGGLPYVTKTGGEDLDEVIERSSDLRERVRGEAVGELG